MESGFKMALHITSEEARKDVDLLWKLYRKDEITLDELIDYVNMLTYGIVPECLQNIEP